MYYLFSPLLDEKGELVVRVPDYQDYFEDGKFVVEDCKGMKTPLYLWKRRHFEIQYGVKIRET